MSFKEGNQGNSLWEDCRKYGVAAITYYAVADIDLSKYSKMERPKNWNKLFPSQKNCLDKIAYEMMPNDIIYVKDGHYIVGKGIIKSKYFLDINKKIIDGNDIPWQHQVEVQWQDEFYPFEYQFSTQRFTIVEITGETLTKLFAEEGKIELFNDDFRKEENYGVKEGKKANKNCDVIIRNRKLIKEKKETSDYKCEVCNFSFKEKYGDIGLKFIEAHHKNMLSFGERITKLADIALLCSNCHSMIHKKNPPYKINELKSILL